MIKVFFAHNQKDSLGTAQTMLYTMSFVFALLYTKVHMLLRFSLISNCMLNTLDLTIMLHIFRILGWTLLIVIVLHIDALDLFDHALLLGSLEIRHVRVIHALLMGFYLVGHNENRTLELTFLHFIVLKIWLAGKRCS